MKTYRTQWGDVIPIRPDDDGVEFDYSPPTFDIAAEIAKETAKYLDAMDEAPCRGDCA